MQSPTKITFVGFLLAVSTLSVSAAKVHAKTLDESNTSSKGAFLFSCTGASYSLHGARSKSGGRDRCAISRDFKEISKIQFI